MSNDPNANNSGTRQPEPGTATRPTKQGQRQDQAPDHVTIEQPEGDVNVEQPER